MTDDRDDRSGSIGDKLDDIRWDYSPPNRERRFFLSPMSTFFGAFPWEGAAQMMPVPPRSQAAETAPSTRDSKTDQGGSE